LLVERKCTNSWQSVMQVPFLSDDFRGESKVTFQNVPACVRGKTFFSLKGSTAESGMWEITYFPPTKVYVARHHFAPRFFMVTVTVDSSRRHDFISDCHEWFFMSATMSSDHDCEGSCMSHQ